MYKDQGELDSLLPVLGFPSDSPCHYESGGQVKEFNKIKIKIQVHVHVDLTCTYFINLKLAIVHDTGEWTFTIEVFNIKHAFHEYITYLSSCIVLIQQCLALNDRPYSFQNAHTGQST